MDLKLRAASLEDIDEIVKVEASAMTSAGYAYDNRYYFLGPGTPNRGEMTAAFAGDEMVGIGQFSVMPDGTAWLETLRVKKEWQRRGVGRAIYGRYIELMGEFGTPSAAMFTGNKNIASKTLAELNGFRLAESFSEYALLMDAAESGSMGGFEPVYCPKKARELVRGWGRFMALNRTFMHNGDALCDWLAARGAVYSDGHSTVVLGCRMLEERGWHIGYCEGDMDACLSFAIAATKRRGLPKINVTFPTSRVDIAPAVQAKGFTQSGELIVMERLG